MTHSYSCAAAVAVAALSSLVAAQDKALRPRDFLPTDHTTVIEVDVARIIDSGLFDAIERSPARMLLDAFRDQYGFDLAELDRVTCGQRIDPPADPAQPWARKHVQAWVLEGSDKVGLAAVPEETLEHMQRERVGAVEMLDGYGIEVASPRPGLVVFGREGTVGEVVRGERRGGAPVPDLVVLAASPNAIALMAAVTSEGMPLGPETLTPMPADWFAEDDMPVGIRLQIVQRGDGDDAEIACEVLLRFENGEQGPARYRAGLDSGREAFAEMPGAKVFVEVFEGLQQEVDGRDLTLTLPLGNARQAAARLTAIIAASALLLQPESVVEPAEAVELVEAVPVAEPAPEKKK